MALGGGICAIVNHINEAMLYSPNDRKLKKSTVTNAITRGEFGVSPLKNGRRLIVPPKLMHGIAYQAMMMQAAGEGEASSLK